MILNNKENMRKTENKNFSKNEILLENDNIEILKKRLKETEGELEKVKKQNFELVVRLKNKIN